MPFFEIIVGGIIVAAFAKSAQIGLHVWLVDAMEGPTPVSALIHAATMVTAGVFMVARMSPLFEYSATARSFILVIGAITALFMGLLGIVQNDIKRIESISIDESFMEFQDKAKLQKYETLEFLNKLLIEAMDSEAKQAELEALRQAEMLRQQQERDAQIAREAAEKATREAEEKARFEAERVQREKLEAEQREAKLKYEAEQALIREQQLKEQAEQQARQAEIDKALAIERAEQAAKQAEHNKQLAIQAERERIEREVREKEEAERREQERREADKAHKKQVCDAILAELAKINIDEKTGQDLIKAIYNNQIPNIKITF